MHGKAAVVTGAYHEKGTSKGKPNEYRDPFTGGLMNMNGTWQLSLLTTVFQPANNDSLRVKAPCPRATFTSNSWRNIASGYGRSVTAREEATQSDPSIRLWLPCLPVCTSSSLGDSGAPVSAHRFR